MLDLFHTAYRYEVVTYSGGVDEFDNPIPGVPRIELRTYTIRTFTPKGFVIDLGYRDRFVNTGALKQFAHRNEKDALVAFIARRKCEARILKARLEKSQAMLTEAEHILKAKA